MQRASLRYEVSIPPTSQSGIEDAAGSEEEDDEAVGDAAAEGMADFLLESIPPDVPAIQPHIESSSVLAGPPALFPAARAPPAALRRVKSPLPMAAASLLKARHEVSRGRTRERAML